MAFLMSWNLAGEPLRDQVKGCDVSGQLFTIDPLLNEMLVKSPSGQLDELRFGHETVFTRLSSAEGNFSHTEQITVESVDAGDEICARSSPGGGKQPVAEVLVVNREQIEARQKQTLTSWLKSGAFGMVVMVEPEPRTLWLTCGAPSGSTRTILVDSDPAVEIRRFLPEAAYLKDPTHVDWSQIHVGDWAYVRGEAFGGAASIRAKQILIGNFQVVAGTIDAIQPMVETISLHDLDAGQTIPVRMKPPSLFMIDPEISTRSRHLLTLDYSDLKVGDGVLIIGRRDATSGTMNGLALIVDFGRFAVPPESPDDAVSWSLGSPDLYLP